MIQSPMITFQALDNTRIEVYRQTYEDGETFVRMVIDGEITSLSNTDARELAAALHIASGEHKR